MWLGDKGMVPEGGGIAYGQSWGVGLGQGHGGMACRNRGIAYKGRVVLTCMV